MGVPCGDCSGNRRGDSGDRMAVGLLTVFIMVTCCVDISIQAGGDCMSGNTIDCFECNSWDDPRCHDPWNWTYPKSTMPPTAPCEGCCVKMVQFIGTQHYQIKRTCTDSFEVNFFMVNHACMTEGHRHGHMCFCEEDECNKAWKTGRVNLMMVSIGSLLTSVVIEYFR